MELWRWQHGAGSGRSTADLTAVEFDEISGWDDDDHAGALTAFKNSLGHIATTSELRGVAEAASQCAARDAKSFFERFFSAHRVNTETSGLLTGYFEPELDASKNSSITHQTPIYARPPDLELVGNVDVAAVGSPHLTAGRRIGGVLQPYFTRAEIDAGALNGRGLELAFAADPIDAFVMHVQGSGVLRFGDGARRVTFAGKNGHAYTSIAKRLIERGVLDAHNAHLDNLLEWLRADAMRAAALMQENESYIFFEMLPESETAPRGSLCAPLTEGRSLAVDPGFHALGFPIWVSAPTFEFQTSPFARLMIAQDTGSAIRGAARGDVFCGTGAAAGRIAGRMKHACTFFALSPKLD